MEQITVWVQETIGIFGYAGIVFLMMLESIIFPLPSEIILPLAGFLVSQGVLNLWLVTIAATLGSVLGSMISYEIGRSGGRPFLVKYGRYFWMEPERLKSTDRWFHTHGEITIVLARMLPFARYVISIPAGIARMDRKRFIVFTAIGSFIWNIALVYGGVLLGTHWYTILDYGAQIEIVIGTIVILFLIWYGYQAVRRRSRTLRRLEQENLRRVRENVRVMRHQFTRARAFGQQNVARIKGMARPRAKEPPIDAAERPKKKR